MDPDILTPSEPPTVDYVEQQSNPGPTYPKELPLKSFHFMFGIVQMLIGMQMFMLEFAALSTLVPIATGAGIYCGVVIFVAGLLSVLGSRLNSRPLITACMILNIIATVACVIGLCWASYEITRLSYTYAFNFERGRYAAIHKPATTQFAYGKSVFIIVCCVFEFMLTILHASLSCRSVCLSCMSQSIFEDEENVIPTTSDVGHQTDFPIHEVAYMPQAAISREPGDVEKEQEFDHVDPQQLQGVTVGPSHNEASRFKYMRLPE